MTAKGNVLIVGVGGQGVLLASEVLASVGVARDELAALRAAHVVA